jgi:hypothetical protein
MIKKFVLIWLLCSAMSLMAQEALNNILIYGEGNVQVTSEVNEYQNIYAGAPIVGSIMITHTQNNPVDASSFRMGDKTLSVQFVQSVPMSDYGSYVVSIYHFQIGGMQAGIHTLPPIQVKVGNKTYQAAPLTLQVGR